MLELLEPGFLQNALIGGIGMALLTGPLGCFILWRRMAYVGDALGHTALLGAALGVVLGFSPMLGIFAIAILAGLILSRVPQHSRHAPDAVLGIMAHGGLSLGLVLLSLSLSSAIDLNAFLFGDILAISSTDHIRIYAMAVGMLALLAIYWRDFLLLTVHEDIARVEGIKVERLRLLLVLMIAGCVAVSIPLVGILLITALLILPASAARQLARTPLQMAILAVVIGILSVFGGLEASREWDTPSGASIVVAALTCFMFLSVIALLFRK